MPERDKNGKFVQGNSGNPKGRPPKESTFSDIAKEMLNSNEISIKIKVSSPNNKDDDGNVIDDIKEFKITSENQVKYSLAAALLTDGIMGNIAATKEFLNRAEGMPKQSVETKDITDVPREVKVLNEKDIDIINQLGN